METFNVTDEFECHRKCIHNNTCKSFNVHPPKRGAIKKTCEMNNQTRQMKPKQYKKKTGSSYHGSVGVSLIWVLIKLPSRLFLEKSGNNPSPKSQPQNPLKDKVHHLLFSVTEHFYPPCSC